MRRPSPVRRSRPRCDGYGGMCVAVLGAPFTLVACMTVVAQPHVAAADLVVEPINTAVYDCARPDGTEFEFTIRRGAGEIALWLPFEFNRPYLVLSEVFDGAASTGTFRESDVSVAPAERDAALTVGSQRFTGCAYDRVRSIWEHAKLSGGDFRASGEEPAWYLELRREDRLEFRTADPEHSLRVPWAEIEQHTIATGVTYLYGAGPRAVEVVIDLTACDVPDGLAVRGSRVTVTVDGMVFDGCGRALH